MVDYPHSTRAKKYFLVLMVGSSSSSLPVAHGLDGEEPDEGEVQVRPVGGGRGKGAVDE